jgi:hypothetical protein
VSGTGLAIALQFAIDIASLTDKVIVAMTSIRTVASYQGSTTAAAMLLFVRDVQSIVSSLTTSAGLFTGALVQAEAIATTGAQIGQALLNGMLAAANAPTGITSAFEAIFAAVMATFVALQAQFASMKTAAWAFGRDWVLMLVNGLESRLGDLEDLMAYIRGLFPSSPAKFGAWRTLPEGKAVGKEFATDLASGVWGGAGGVVGALGALREAFGISPRGLATTPAAISSGGSITININNPTVRSNRDIEMMASQISDILAMRAATSSRLGHTW